VIGGNLQAPSADESEQLDRINLTVPPERHNSSGLLLSGHQPNDTVARWVAAARFGLPGYAAANGVYVCGSLKEEFGIALLEAMATGLMIVAPEGGGPATYVDDTVTGFLTRTSDVALLEDAITAAFAAVGAETSSARAELSRDTVSASFTIQAMATALTEVYVGVGAAERDEAARDLAARDLENWTVSTL
jgi:glycosyltransferase involved in cell wall biosynthesis